MEAKRPRQEETESEVVVDNLSATIHSKKRKRDLDEDYAGDAPSVILDKGKKQCNIQSNKRKHPRVSFKLKSKEGSSNKRKTKNGAKRGKKENAKKKKNISANLISRQSPCQLVRVLKSLTDRQKAVLREIGFGCMVDFSIKSLPMSLAFLLVDRLDAEKCEMMVGEKLMKITKKDVHEILGFPMRNREVKSLRKAGLVENDLAKTWKLRFPMPKKGSQFIKLTDVSKKIKGEPEGGSTFKFDILLSIVTVMAEGITCGTINQRVLGSINDENDIKDMDWCGYVIDCLKRSKDKWSKDSWYAGPLTFLVVWYARHISKSQKGNPAILHWTTEELKLIEQMEISGAKFDEEMQYPKTLSIDYPDRVPYAGDGDEDLEYNNETNLDDRESTINENASEVEFDYQTIKNHEERKQVFINGIHKAYDNLHRSNEQFISELKSGLANFPGDLDVIGQVNIVKEKWLTDLGNLTDVHESPMDCEPQSPMLARAQYDPEESQPQIYEETNSLALVVWSPPIVPGIPLVSLEANRKPLKSSKSERRSQNANRVSRLKLPSDAPAAPLGNLRVVPEPKDYEIQSPNAVAVSRVAEPKSTVLQFAKSRKLLIERSDPRNKTLLQKGSFFHSHTGQPMAREYVFGEEDSEDEVDVDVADLEGRRMLDDFIDVTQPEKKMMNLWNSFMRKQGVLADAHVPWACEAFSTQHGKEFIQTPSLLWCWRLFMIKLSKHGLLDAKAMNKCNLILEGFQDQIKANQ